MSRHDSGILCATRADRSRSTLPKTFEGLLVDSELFEDPVEQGRPDITPAYNLGLDTWWSKEAEK